MIVSSFNKLDGNRYYDVESQTSFEFDHVSQVRMSEQRCLDKTDLSIESLCGAIISSRVSEC